MSAAKQLRLLPVPKPLTEHLGAEFFRGIPKVPGVYRMFDATGALLYVGQSANLRDRLNSYRHVHPDRDSRKTVRLVHRVRRIEWEVCDSPVSAVLRENELLRTLRPRFNRQNVYPPACWFIAVAGDNGSLVLSLTRDRATAHAQLFGAFKGAAAAFPALCRLLHVLTEKPDGLAAFPARLLTTTGLRRHRVVADESVRLLVVEYLAGKSGRLVSVLITACASIEMRSAFEQNLLLADLLMVESFYERGPQRVQQWLQQAGRSESWVAPETLLDLIAVEQLLA